MGDPKLIGKLLIVAGLILAAMGSLFLVGQKIPGFGHLPGDISIQRRNFRFYFPLTTCILLSIVLTTILWLLRRR